MCSDKIYYNLPPGHRFSVIVPHVKRSRINLNIKCCCKILFQMDTLTFATFRYTSTHVCFSNKIQNYDQCQRCFTIFNTKYKMLHYYAGQAQNEYKTSMIAFVLEFLLHVKLIIYSSISKPVSCVKII